MYIKKHRHVQLENNEVYALNHGSQENQNRPDHGVYAT